MGQGKKGRPSSRWADAAYWSDDEEKQGVRSVLAPSEERTLNSTKKKGKERKKGRELVDKRISDSGFQLRSEKACESELQPSNQEEAGDDVEERLWNAVQKGKGKIYRRAEEKVRIGGEIPPPLVEMFADSFSLDVVETVYESTGHDTEATVKALLSMSGEAVPSNPFPGIRSADKASSSQAQVDLQEVKAGEAHLWDTLPEECKQLVLERLSPLDAARAARVCRDFAAFVRSLRAKTTALAIPASLTDIEHIMGFLRAFPNVSSVSFRKCRTTLTPPKRWSIFHRLHIQDDRPEGAKPIRSIDFGGITTLDSFDIHVLCQNPHLTHLDLSNTNLDDPALKVLAHFPASSLPRTSLAHFLQQGSEEALGLRSLNLAGCLWITERGLEPVLTCAEVKRTLEFLDVSKCTSLTRGAVTHAAVRTLVAVGSTWERFAVTQGQEKRLQDLNLAQSLKLAEVTIHLATLVDLNLSGCAALTKLELRCPNLETLKLAQCTGLEEFGAIHCPKLTRLSVFQCRQLTSETLSDVMASVPLLSELNCSGCSSLFRLDLASNSQLTKVDVSGCNRLGRLTVMSPALVTLSARGCSHLIELRLDSQQVQELLLNNCRALKEVRLPVLFAGAAHSETGSDVQRIRVDIRGCLSLPDTLAEKLIEVGRRRTPKQGV